jgi:aminomethyltransferase
MPGRGQLVSESEATKQSEAEVSREAAGVGTEVGGGLLTTPLHAWHQQHGGRMVPFAGWEMPVQYTSIVDEHLATRSACGLFDVSHMGRLVVSGPGSRAWLDSMLTRRVSDLAAGGVRYTLITDDDGGKGVRILDDALVACEAEDRFGLVVNGSNRDRVVAWLKSRLPSKGVCLDDQTRRTAMIAVQGPASLATVTSLCTAPDAERINALKNYRSCAASVAGHAATVSRSGYTGEDGVELIVAAEAAVPVWEALLAADPSARACGLGARDTLRLEAGMPLYGHELVETTNPFAIGLGRGVSLEGRQFPGRDAFARLQAGAAERVRVGLMLTGKRAAREGCRVFSGTQDCGVITSGSFAPSLAAPIAMAMVDAAVAEPGTQLDVDIRGSRQPASICPLPFPGWRRVE